MTIEQRAREVFPSTELNDPTWERRGYIKGATEQQKIDEQDKQEVLAKQKQELIAIVRKKLNMIDNETIENAAKLYCSLRSDRNMKLDPEKAFISGVYWMIEEINKVKEE